MGFWIRAVCTKSVGPLAAIDLAAALSNCDFETWAEVQGLSEPEGAAAEEALRFEYPKHRTQEYGLLRYRADDHFIRFDRWTDDAARKEADEMLESLDEASPDEVREVLADCVETIGFELKASDVAGMGFNIALAAAMVIAVEGEGLVQTDNDGDTWFDPETGDEL
jgi:hypothetical protein